MKKRQAVDPIIVREVRRLQGLAEGLPPRARRRIKGLAFMVLLLDCLAQYADPGPDPWGFWAWCYHKLTDLLAEAHDEAVRWAH